MQQLIHGKYSAVLMILLKISHLKYSTQIFLLFLPLRYNLYFFITSILVNFIKYKVEPHRSVLIRN